MTTKSCVGHLFSLVVILAVASCDDGSFKSKPELPDLPVRVRAQISFWSGQYLSVTNYGQKVLTNVTITVKNPDGTQLVMNTGGIAPGEEWTANTANPIWGKGFRLTQDDNITLTADGYKDVKVTGQGLAETK